MKNKKLEFWLIFITGVAGLVLFLSLRKSAFPEVAVNLKISKNEAIIKAETYLKEQNFNTEGYEKHAIFLSDDLSVSYLERSLGIKEANKFRIEKNPMQGWVVRFFQELKEEEFEVHINPESGDIEAFTHTLPEIASGNNLSKEESQKIVEGFLKTRDVDIEKFSLIASNVQKRENRSDYSFTYEENEYKLGNTTVRIDIDVCGDQVCNYNGKYLKIPEDFERNFDREMANGQLLSLISMICMVVLGAAALVVFIIGFKKDKIKIKFGIYFSLICFVILILNGLNNISIIQISYPTQIKKIVFFTTVLGGALTGILFMSLVIALFGSAGEFLSREIYGDKAPILSKIKSKLFSYEFAKSVFNGYMLAFIFLGYITVFYLAASKMFSVWSLPDPSYSNILSTPFPFLAPLTVGLIAALSEEFMFRFFAIPFLKKYLKISFFAVLISSMIWAFAHSTYPVFPVYIRGIELTIAGMVFGYFYLKYNIETVIIAHYIIDSVLIGLPLLKSSNTYFIISGWIVIGFVLLPILLWSIDKIRRHFLNSKNIV